MGLATPRHLNRDPTAIRNPLLRAVGIRTRLPRASIRADATVPQPGAAPGKSHEEYAEDARENLGGPAFAKEMDYNVNTVRSGDDVLTRRACLRMT